MSTAAEINAKVKDLMAKGDIAGARAALDEKPSDAPAAAASAEPAPPPKPRTPEEVVLDCLLAVGNILGNHPVLAPLLAELKDVTATKADAEPKAS